MGIKAPDMPFNEEARPEEPGHNAPEPVTRGRYPRSLKILAFILNDLFLTGYALAHATRKTQKNDSASYMIEQDPEIYRTCAHVLPDVGMMFDFEARGKMHWAPLELRLLVLDWRGWITKPEKAHPVMKAAFEEFMDDISLAATNLQGVRVNFEKGIIRTNDPMALFRLVRQVIRDRSMLPDIDDGEKPLRKDGTPAKTAEDDPAEHKRPIDMMTLYSGQTYDDDSYKTTNDALPGEGELLHGMAQLGADYLMDEDPEGAMNNLPMRPYIGADDLYREVFTLKGRMENGESVFSLDEAEAIILEETTGQRYGANPLLNPQ